jgi:HlyD family secretion protein
MLRRILKFVVAHKIVTVILVGLLIFSGWFGFNQFSKKQTTSKYVISAATKGTLISSISGTGQVATSNEVAISSKVSGEITYVGVTAGEDVSDGKLLIKIDSTDAEQAIKDAQANYDLAVLSLAELKAPVDELTLMQAEDSLTSAEQSEENATDALDKAYNDGFNSVANTFLDLPDVMTGLNDALYGHAITTNQGNADYYADNVKSYNDDILRYKDDAYAKYLSARTAYDKNFSDYKSLSRTSSTENIESLISETYGTSMLIAESVKSTNNLIQFYKDELVKRSLKYNSVADTQSTSLNTYTSKTNSILSTLLSSKQTIANDKQTIVNSERDIAEKQISLNKVKAGATDISIRSQELAVTQKYNALLSAKESLNDYYITAPFSGTVAKIDVSKGDSVSVGTALATFISKGKIVSVSLNEVDISKVKVGDATTLTFDALTDLELTGKVAQVDTIGTVSSGVVNYSVEISFADDTDSVKPGMSASVNIITEAKTDVLLVPNSAVKSSNGSYYVEAPAVAVDVGSLDNSKGVSLKGALTNKTVEIGSSNDSSTEITNGLSENDQVVISVITGSISSKSTASTSKSTTSTTTKSTNGNMMMQGLGGPPN